MDRWEGDRWAGGGWADVMDLWEGVDRRTSMQQDDQQRGGQWWEGDINRETGT